MSTRTINRCQLVPNLIRVDNECMLYITARLVCVIYVLHRLGLVQFAIKFNVMISSYK